MNSEPKYAMEGERFAILVNKQLAYIVIKVEKVTILAKFSLLQGTDSHFMNASN